MVNYVLVFLVLAGCVALLIYWIVEFFRRKGKIVQRLEPQDKTNMDIVTEVFYRGDLIKKWTVTSKFSKVEERAIQEKAEAKSLIKLFKKIRN